MILLVKESQSTDKGQYKPNMGMYVRIMILIYYYGTYSTFMVCVHYADDGYRVCNIESAETKGAQT